MKKDKTQQNSLDELGKDNLASQKKSKPSRLAISGMVLATLLGTQVVLSAWISLDMKLFPEHWHLVAESSVGSTDPMPLSVFGGQAEASEKTTSAAAASKKDAGTKTTSSKSESSVESTDKKAVNAEPKETYAYSAPKDIQSWAASKNGVHEDEVAASLAPTPEDIAEEVNSSLSAEKEALLQLPEGKELVKFDAMTQDYQAMEGASAQAIEAAIQGFNDIGCDVGFVLYDLSSQLGLSYNVDQSFFAASTIKAPFASYAMEAVSRGEASLDEEIAETRSMEGTGVMAYDDRSTYSLEEVFANTLMHSDNTGYLLLQDRFSREAFGDWAAETGSGLDSNLYLSADGFPSASARMMALLWNKIASNAWTVPTHVGDNTTLGTAFNPDETPILNWLNNADESFIRAALGDSAAVYSKTGYETPEWGASALNDCGLVVDEYGPYLLIMLTSAPFDDTFFRDNESYATALIQALSQARQAEIIEQP